MQMQMYVTKTKYCDYISYNPNFNKCIVIIRIKRDDKKIDKLIKGLEAGKEKIISLKKQYEEANN